MNYRDQLPDNCPPKNAQKIVMPLSVFRLVKTNPPTEEDFQSLRTQNPARSFPKSEEECRACGLSVFARRKDIERLLKLPRMRGQLICEVSLGAGAGKIQQTGPKSHHTWWPFAGYDILAGCRV